MKKPISPVTRGNLLAIQERIKELHPSYPHCKMLQQQIQKAFFLLKVNEPENEKLMVLFTEINCNGEGQYDGGKFLRVQREALGLLSAVLDGEMVRPA